MFKDILCLVNYTDNDKHLFDIMATGPKSTYVTINISTEHVTVY